MPNESTTWLITSASVGSSPIAMHDQRRRQGDRPPQEDRDPALDEPLHHDLAGHRADRGGGEPGGEQGDAEDRRRVAGHRLPEPVEGALDAVDRRAARRC